MIGIEIQELDTTSIQRAVAALTSGQYPNVRAKKTPNQKYPLAVTTVGGLRTAVKRAQDLELLDAEGRPIDLTEYLAAAKQLGLPARVDLVWTKAILEAEPFYTLFGWCYDIIVHQDMAAEMTKAA